MRRTVAVVLLVSLAAGLHGPSAEAQESSGITVSAPKVYEERALRVMLDAAEEQLEALRPISATKFDASVGALQGGRQSSSAFSLTAQGPASPQVVSTEMAAPNAESGELETTSLQTATTEAAASAAPPAPPAQAALAGSGFGLSARDLLVEQVALTYQIASLRLALERATSDRFNVLPNPPHDDRVVVRKPVVLGFTVGVDRPRKDRVAEVELTIDLVGGETPRATPKAPPGATATAAVTPDERQEAEVPSTESEVAAEAVSSLSELEVEGEAVDPDTSMESSSSAPPDGFATRPAEPLDSQATKTSEPSPPGLSLVTLIPAKDAYNVAAITDSSANIGVGQIVSAFQLGAGYSWGHKTYYVVRDVDTVSITRSPEPGHPNRIRVAWQFRPVLGRKIVEPGPRQVFVVLAIDDDRFDYSDFSLSTSATTRWLRLGRKGVLKDGSEPGESLPLGDLGYWQIFDDKVRAPFLQAPEVTILSDRLARVYAPGSFLTEDSRVVVGDRIIDRSNGLELQSDTALSFVVPLVDLARAHDVYLVNRHQAPLPIHRRADPREGALPLSLSGSDCRFEPDGERGTYSVKIRLVGSEPPEATDLLALAGDTVVVGKAQQDGIADTGRETRSVLQSLRTEPCGAIPGGGCVDVTFELPRQAVRSAQEVVIREMLGGPARSVRCDTPRFPVIDKVVVVRKTDKDVRLALQGRSLRQLAHAIVGTEEIEFTKRTDEIALLDVTAESLKGVEILLVEVEATPTTPEEILPVALKVKPEIKKPAFGAASVGQHFSGPLEVPGSNLDAIETVSFEGLELKRSLAGGKLTVLLVSRVTEHAGTRTLMVKLSDGAEVPLPVTVRAAG
jgi:hypothetical protein